MSSFEVAFKRLIDHEGAFTDNPKDPGNWTGGVVGVGKLLGTKYGIAANTYPDLDIKNLTLDDAKAIYYRDWWLKAGGDQLPFAVVYQLWDMAVNTGMGNAKRTMQKAVKVLDDGNFGPQTLAAIKAMSVTDVILRFNSRRLRYYTSMGKWADFGKGWVNRVAGQLDIGAEDT